MICLLKCDISYMLRYFDFKYDLYCLGIRGVTTAKADEEGACGGPGTT